MPGISFLLISRDSKGRLSEQNRYPGISKNLFFQKTQYAGILREPDTVFKWTFPILLFIRGNWVFEHPQMSILLFNKIRVLSKRMSGPRIKNLVLRFCPYPGITKFPCQRKTDIPDIKKPVYEFGLLSSDNESPKDMADFLPVVESRVRKK